MSEADEKQQDTQAQTEVKPEGNSLQIRVVSQDGNETRFKVPLQDRTRYGGYTYVFPM